MMTTPSRIKIGSVEELYAAPDSKAHSYPNQILKTNPALPGNSTQDNLEIFPQVA